MMRHKKTIHGFQESDREEEQSDEQSEDVRESDTETMQEEHTDDNENAKEKDDAADNSGDDTSDTEESEKEDIWFILKSKARSKIGVDSLYEVENIDEDEYNDLRHEMRNKIIDYYLTLCHLWSICKDDITHMEIQNTKKKLEEEFDLNPNESLSQAVKMRRHLIDESIHMDFKQDDLDFLDDL